MSDAPRYGALPPDPISEEREPAPLGVKILMVLHLIGGVGLLGLGMYMLSTLVTGNVKLPAGIDDLKWQLLLGVLFLGVLGFASGVGMWKGTPWGWRLATFYYVNAIWRNANTLILAARLSDEAFAQNESPEKYYFKYGIRLLVSLSILAYFFKPNVRMYFGMEHAQAGRMFRWLFFALLMHFAMGFGLGSLFESSQRL